MKHNVSFDVELKKHTFPGKYIVIEGIDGSGKTTQVEKLRNYLASKGKNVVVTKEPSRVGPFGDLIRKILKKEISVPPVSYQYLAAADRAVQLEDFVIPNLQDGKVIVSDRCFWSSISYGLADADVKDTELAAYSILSMYNQFLEPDITFYLDVSVDTAAKRIAQKKDGRELYEEKEKLEKVKERYDWLLGKFPEEFVIVDAEKPVEEVTSAILAKIKYQI